MPIRVRLALWYSGIFGAVLAVFGTALYVLMVQHLDGMVEDSVGFRANHLATAIGAANPVADGMGPIRTPLLDAFETPEVYVQVLALDGKIQERSSNLEGHTLPLPEGPWRQTRFTATVDGVDMLVSLLPAVADGRTVAWVQVAGTYRLRDVVLDRLRWVLLGGGIAAMVAVAILSGALAGRALSPISEITETAKAIALSRGFSRRLGVSNPNDELGQLAETFNEMLASLEEAYSAQQRFTADASHELRAPLTAIRGNLDLLDRIKTMPADERQQMLNRVRQEVERLSRLVNDLLSLARADAGQGLEVRPVELDTLLMDAHRQATVMADGIKVALNHVEPAIVQGDEDRLKELLLILVDNALRYTPEGGAVTLWLRHEPPWVSIGVEDTGIGIDPEDIPRVLDRFWRADRARSRYSGGTGLGLAIASWIVDHHGGEILVDSTPGKGSRFVVHLPSAS